MAKAALKWPTSLLHSAFGRSTTTTPTSSISANHRGADKIIYSGYYYPMARQSIAIFASCPNVPFREHVWPSSSTINAARGPEPLVGRLLGTSCGDHGHRAAEHRPVHSRGMLLSSDLGAEVLRVRPRDRRRPPALRRRRSTRSATPDSTRPRSTASTSTNAGGADFVLALL